MHFENKRVIIFDLDGTLIDSIPDLTEAVNYMLGQLTMERCPQERVRHWVGNGVEILVKRALLGDVQMRGALDNALFEKGLRLFLEYYKEHLGCATTLYPHVKTTLKTLHARGYTLALVTNKPIAFAQPILDGLHLASLFSICLGGDSLANKKPHPQPLLHVCNELDITPSQSVMVGDSKNDIEAANSASMQSIGVSYGYNYGESIEAYNPSVVVEDFAQILEFLEG